VEGSIIFEVRLLVVGGNEFRGMTWSCVKSVI